MKRLAVYIVILLLFVADSSPGQPAARKAQWSITDCLSYAETHNLQINTLRLNEQSAYQDLWSAKGLQIPSLSALLSNTWQHANYSTDGSSRLVNQVVSSGIYSINSSIVVWNGHYIQNTIRESQLLTETSKLSVEQSVNNITLLITSAYLDILLAKENQKYIEDLVSTSEAREKQGQQLFEAGSIAKKDLLQLQAQLAGDRYTLVQTRNTVRQTTLTLKQILQLPSEAPFDILLPDSLAVVPSLPDLPTVQEAAMQHFPDVKIGMLQQDIARIEIAKARAGFKPILKGNGAMGTSYSDVLTNAVNPKATYFTQAGNNFYQLIAATLSIPIFSNRVNKANVTKAMIAYQEARLNYENDRLLLSQAVEQRYLDASNALESYQAAQVQLKAATETYRIGNEAFRLGGINIYDLLQQRNQYVQAVQAFTQAKYSAVLEQKIYEFYSGKPITLQ